MAKTVKMRVEIPTNVSDFLSLATNIFNKHQADGGSSPLLNMQDHDWSVTGPTIVAAQKDHNDAENLRLQMEKAYKNRDLKLAAIKEVTLASRDVLTGICRSNMKRMGDWGFTVDNTPKAKKTPPPAP